jgi:ubiquinone/menaquinone biosynthesis C-methylase UbiE
VRVLGNPEPIRRVREKIIPWGQGTVLEIGVGPGANFVHYDPANVTKVYALEPNPGMIRLADAERQRAVLDVEFLKFPGERIPLDDRSVDTVVSTFTFCSIPDVAEAVLGIRRVLRPPSAKMIAGLTPSGVMRSKNLGWRPPRERWT